MTSHARSFFHPPFGQTNIGQFGPDWLDGLHGLRPIMGTSQADELPGTEGFAPVANGTGHG